MGKIETRRFQRYATIQKIFYRTDSQSPYKPGFTRNVSRNGLLIKSGESIPPGETIEIFIKINDTNIQFKGTCIYCLECGEKEFQIGILILKINTSGAEDFLSLIKKLEEKQVKNQKNLVPQTTDIENIVKRISAEHKIITQHVVVLQAMMGRQEPPVPLTQVEMTLNLMKKEITTHFYIEEKIFFKIGLAHLPDSFHGLIHELAQEHRDMKDQLDRIIVSVQEAIEKRASWGEELKGALREFLGQVKEHAKKEIVDLFPALENSTQAKAQFLLTLRKIITT